ncbi:3D domain-containing protein [Caldalkalibacillus salinus]|uniref:3D domain-containing protein n=1 Tax=Caldalkalibacillus salinus TaxID=2803787 RepID=UPI001922700B|nr:3D domain-containing protein [Caldalkalibacillus salinus]
MWSHIIDLMRNESKEDQLGPYVTQRFVLPVLMLTCLLSVAYGLVTYEIKVGVQLDGKHQEVSTQANTVEELMKELDVEVSHRDILQPSADTALESGLTVVWEPAKNVNLDYRGQRQSVWTTADTVEAFLEEENIKVQESEELNVALQDRIRHDQQIQIAHIEQEEVTETYTVPYQTIRREDDELLRGQERVVQKGIAGEGIDRFLVTWRNGEEYSREKISTEVVRKKQDKIVAVGTKASVSRGGYVFAPSRVLQDVTLTAYSARSAGKGKNDSQYGMTSSGTRASDGRTIAVDPNIIPIGTWVYIDGVGLRRAEDIGGAVRGNKIDVYFEDHNQAVSFGTRHGYTVYVIGPERPTASE